MPRFYHMINVILLGKTQIERDNFLRAAHQVLKRSLTKTIDREGLSLDKSSSLLLLYSEFVNPGSTSHDSLSQPGFISKHIFYSFLIVAPSNTQSKMMEYVPTLCSEVFDEQYELLISTASLHQWRQAVTDGLANSSPKVIKEIMEHILILLHREGYSKLWTNVTRNQSGELKLK